ncbi:UMP kinase [Candidatus Legionella polyplacis]|uniref:Uridylate kinase n=1 Tax=Candidatus Legionella polyplacis TaxID=2005262 RepID=A0ABZ2GYL5_9GAMM
MVIKENYVFKYKRVLLKYSGKALLGNNSFGIDFNAVNFIRDSVVGLINMGIEVALMIGGGNFFRGSELSCIGFDRVTGDHIGMLSTVLNALAIHGSFKKINVPSFLMSSIPIMGITNFYDQNQAINYLNKKYIVIFTAGLGNPFFTTDSAACLRAIEINADIMLKATIVDGIYSDDPIKNSEAIFYKFLTYNKILKDELKIMDTTAVYLCQKYDMPFQVFKFSDFDVLKKIMFGEQIGTIVSGD